MKEKTSEILEKMIENCKTILKESGLNIISDHFEAIEETNLIGETPEQILHVSDSYLHYFNSWEGIQVLHSKSYRLKLENFFIHCSNHFYGLFTYPQCLFFIEMIFEQQIDYPIDEQITALEFLGNYYSEDDYIYYRHYLEMRYYLQEKVELPIKIQACNFYSTYQKAELFFHYYLDKYFIEWKLNKKYQKYNFDFHDDTYCIKRPKSIEELLCHDEHLWELVLESLEKDSLIYYVEHVKDHSMKAFLLIDEDGNVSIPFGDLLNQKLPETVVNRITYFCIAFFKNSL